MELLSVTNVSTDTMDILETKCGKQFILRQYYSNGGNDLNYTVYALENGVVGVEVTDEPEVDELMGRYFSVKYELESGITSDDVDNDPDWEFER